MAIADYIKRNKQFGVRKLFFKRRLANNSYEASWQRVDDYKGKSNRIQKWGRSSIEIDRQPAQIATYNVSGVTMTALNYDGWLNADTDDQSFWFTDNLLYLNRKYTKVKIQTGYKDTSGVETGVSDDFEGFINDVELKENGTAIVSILSYQAILKKYLISDLNLTGAKTVSEIITAIFAEAKISKFITLNTNTPNLDYEIADSSLLSGTYWNIIQTLAYKSSSVPYLNGSTFDFKSRAFGATSVYDFKGSGADDKISDVYQVLGFDDEGAGRVRVLFEDTYSKLQAKTSNTTLLAKYLDEPEQIDLTELTDNTQRQNALNALLALWENPKPLIKFTCRYLVNEVSPLDRISIETWGKLTPADFARYNSARWDSGAVWVKVIGGINIASGDSWGVLSVVKDYDKWNMMITAEKI